MLIGQSQRRWLAPRSIDSMEASPDGASIVNGIFLPEKLENIVKKNQRINGAITTALANFSDWLSMNQLVFFPEYTDHGINHIQDVLDTAANIIKEESLELLTPEDIYVLTSAILLHDCAMHIGKNGLAELIQNEKYSSNLFGYQIEKSLAEEWRLFENEVSKYSDSDWLKFFSDGSTVEFPKLEADLTGYQNVIAGEFVRKHHARIAQIISLHGLPTGNKPEVFFSPELVHLNELSGFAARSHNISLREAVDLLKPQHAIFTKNTHLAFLMAVLRVADYLQFENKRTPKICFRIKAFCSPISINEWKKQIAVISTHHSHYDEELLYVDASPDDAITLDGISRLLLGLQRELDSLWAVLGEMYSRFPDKKKLGIKIRRVRSSIDDPVEYVARHYKSFHPYLLSLTTNDERLYPLLAKPLYGNKPLVGLRELIQNSIDACNERFTSEESKDPISEVVPYGIHITIDLDNKKLVINDEGSGMDEDIIKNYFLKIGSSYRYSSSWQENYLQDGNAIVPRTGRFGIGVLAGFLLGEKIEIHTRKLGSVEDKALHFEITPSSQKIQINHKRKDSIGTSILIELNEAAIESLKTNSQNDLYAHNVYGSIPRDDIEETEWRWYYLDSPKIKFTLTSEHSETLKDQGLIEKKSIGTAWQLVETTSSVKCYCRTNAKYSYVYCNGILIPETASPKLKLQSIITTTKFLPYETLFIDNNAVLPLNLQRNGFLTDDFFMQNEIETHILKNHINNAIKHLKNHAKHNNGIHAYSSDEYKLSYPSDSTFAIHDNKATPLYPGFTFDPNQLFIIDYTKSSVNRGLKHSNSTILENNEFGYISVADVEKQGHAIKNILSYIIGCEKAEYYTSLRYSKTETTKKTFRGWHFIKKYDFDKLDESDHIFLKSSGFTTSKLSDEWIALNISPTNKKIPEPILREFKNKTDFKCFMFSLVSIHDNHKETSKAHQLWQEMNLPNTLDVEFLKGFEVL